MMFTIPFAIYGLFRYLQIVHIKELGGEPELLFGDKGMLANFALWGISVVIILILSTLLKYDLHVHSNILSMWNIRTEVIIKLAIKKGLNGIAITDHDTIKGGVECKKFETDSLKVIIGCELNTRQGEIIGLFLTEEIRSRDINEAIDEIHAQGGLVTVPHPFDKMRRSTLRHLSDHVGKIDAIEVFNARCILVDTIKRLRVCKEKNISATAGSDAHYANEIG